MGEKKTLLIDPNKVRDYSDQPGEDGKILFVRPENKKYTTFSPAAKTKSAWLLRTEKTGLSRRADMAAASIFDEGRSRTSKR